MQPNILKETEALEVCEEPTEVSTDRTERAFP